MSKILLTEETTCPKEFLAMWEIWKHKGHNPIEKLSLFESQINGVIHYSIGLLDYISLEKHYFPNLGQYTNYEKAFTQVGRALDGIK